MCGPDMKYVVGPHHKLDCARRSESYVYAPDWPVVQFGECTCMEEDPRSLISCPTLYRYQTCNQPV